MNRTKIEWTRGQSGEPGYSWNPIRGLCPEDCKLPDGKSYCYGRRLYQRFGMNPRLRLDYKELVAPAAILKPARIFVCSTMEVFHPRIPEAWRMEIFNIIASLSSLTFVVLTKHPENITKAMPDNVWLGVSVTGDSNIDYLRVRWLEKAEAKIKFVSLEPLLADPCIWDLFDQEYPAWMIVGRLTGHGKRYDPKLRTLTEIAEFGTANKIPVFLKENLRGIWQGPLTQEFPK